MFHFSEKHGPPKRYFLIPLDHYLDVEKNPPQYLYWYNIFNSNNSKEELKT